jgi:hypothetical protein
VQTQAEIDARVASERRRSAASSAVYQKFSAHLVVRKYPSTIAQVVLNADPGAEAEALRRTWPRTQFILDHAEELVAVVVTAASASVPASARKISAMRLDT